MNKRQKRKNSPHGPFLSGSAEDQTLKIAQALRWTPAIKPDVAIPTEFRQLTKGFHFNAYGDNPRVEPACSSAISHSFGQWDTTTTQKPIELYSSRLLALRALRHAVEEDCAKRLLRIDSMISEEEAKR